MSISSKSPSITCCVGLALLLGVVSSVRADTYNYYITDDASFVNMTPTGGPILGHFVSGNLPAPDHTFLLEVSVSAITSLVPGNVYEWHNPVFGGVIEAVGMNGPANIYDDLPLKNLQPIPLVINGIEISDNPSLWMTEQVNAGNLDVLLEFTVTIGTLPPDIMFISGGFELFSAYSAHTVIDDIVTGYTARFIDENGNPIAFSAVNLGFGESIKVQMTAFAYEAPLNTITGAFQGFGTIEAEVIPEPASALLLVGAVGVGLVAKRWRLLG